ncbi:MAG: CDP-diacylglycerol--glycerol-3-phosphate 3-phosphatidyltransferase [Cellulosilyticum sp.]|nr:CDP-diacylglycerol--glycerol-3-phosphate 3-phosphatidyltransferase [Cellulosilyticum sp.]
MNIANKLTLLRIILVFVFMGVIWIPFNLPIEVVLWISLVIFIVASLTDFLDGYLARKLNLVTNLGKFMDPLADKMLVATALLAIVDLGNKGLLPIGNFPAWIVVFIILREFMVSGLRLIAAGKNIVLAANYWGKVKTVVQMITIIVYLLPIQSTLLSMTGMLLAYASLFLTLISGFIYLWENRKVFEEQQ